MEGETGHTTMFLDALEGVARTSLEAASITRNYPAGSILFAEQQVPEYVFIVERGRVKSDRKRGLPYPILPQCQLGCS